MWPLRIILVLAVVATALVVSARVADAWADDVRMASVDAAPWAYFDARTGKPAGVFPLLAEELSARTGHRVTIDLMSLARLERELRGGVHDCVIILWSDSRAGVVDRGANVHDMTFGIVARKGVPLRSYEDLAPLTISVTRSLSITPHFDHDQSLRKDHDVDYRQGLRKLAHGRVDAIAGALPTIRHQAEEEGLADRLGQQLVLATVPLTLQWRKDSPLAPLLPRFNEALAAMRADGTLDRLFARHYGLPPVP